MTRQAIRERVSAMKRASRPRMLDTLEWRRQEKDGRLEGVVKYVRVARAEGGGMSIIASTGQVDRYGDTIDPAGWVTDGFESNPVFLWAHDYGAPPVGKVGRLEKSAGELVAHDITFTPKEVYPFGAMVGEMYDQEFLNASSVGFVPLAYEKRVDPQSGDVLGYHFTKQELLELSAVPVPANPGALVPGKAFAATLADWAAGGKSTGTVTDAMRAEVRSMLQRAEVQLEASESDEDSRAIEEMLALLRSIDGKQDRIEARVKALEGSMSRGVNVGARQRRAVAAALNALFRKGSV